MVLRLLLRSSFENMAVCNNSIPRSLRLRYRGASWEKPFLLGPLLFRVSVRPGSSQEERRHSVFSHGSSESVTSWGARKQKLLLWQLALCTLPKLPCRAPHLRKWPGFKNAAAFFLPQHLPQSSFCRPRSSILTVSLLEIPRAPTGHLTLAKSSCAPRPGGLTEMLCEVAYTPSWP